MMSKRAKTILKNVILLFLFGLVWYFLLGPKLFWDFCRSILIFLGVPAICVLGYLGFKQLLPKLLPAEEPNPGETYHLGIRTYKRFSFIADLIVTIGFPIGGYLSYIILIYLSNKWYETLTGVIVFGIAEIYWALPSLILAVCQGLCKIPETSAA